MEEIFLEAAKQIPALAVLAWLVMKFVGVFKMTIEVIKENSTALGEVKVALLRANGKEH